jgi:hypothetical protein
VLQTCWVQTPPSAAEMPQLALQQKLPFPQVSSPQVPPTGLPPSPVETCDVEACDAPLPWHDVTALPPRVTQRQELQATVQLPSGSWHNVSVLGPQISGQTNDWPPPTAISPILVDSDGGFSMVLQPKIPTNNSDSTDNTTRISHSLAA